MTTGSQQTGEGNKSADPTSSHGKIAGAYLFGMIARLQAAIMEQMPLGYEDDVGFHVGAKASRDESGSEKLAENKTDLPPDDYPPYHRLK